MVSTERLNKTSDRIKEGRRTMLETEDLGVSILQDLHSQRQSLLHAHNTVTKLKACVLCLSLKDFKLLWHLYLTKISLMFSSTLLIRSYIASIPLCLFVFHTSDVLFFQLHGVDDNIGRSKKILTNMSRRMNKNKWIIISIIVVLVIAIALVLYFKLAK